MGETTRRSDKQIVLDVLHLARARRAFHDRMVVKLLEGGCNTEGHHQAAFRWMDLAVSASAVLRERYGDAGTELELDDTTGERRSG